MSAPLEQAGRVRWLEWVTVTWWLLLGGVVSFYVPRLDRVFASFGSELPLTTELWLGSRPAFLLVFVVAGAFAVFLATTVEGCPRERRRALWVCLAGAVLATGWSVSAAFAPMCMGTLSEGPAAAEARRR